MVKPAQPLGLTPALPEHVLCFWVLPSSQADWPRLHPPSQVAQGGDPVSMLPLAHPATPSPAKSPEPQAWMPSSLFVSMQFPETSTETMRLIPPTPSSPPNTSEPQTNTTRAVTLQTEESWTARAQPGALPPRNISWPWGRPCTLPAVADLDGLNPRFLTMLTSGYRGDGLFPEWTGHVQAGEHSSRNPARVGCMADVVKPSFECH